MPRTREMIATAIAPKKIAGFFTGCSFFLLLEYKCTTRLSRDSFGLHNEHTDDASDNQNRTNCNGCIAAHMMRASWCGTYKQIHANRESDDTKCDNAIVNHWILH